MASWNTEARGSRRDLVVALLVILVILACLAIVGTVEGHSLDPVTGCSYGEILDSRGVCR